VAPPAEPVDPLVGRVLEGRYRLRSRLARGGMGTVYLGVDERLDRPVAVKVMHRALADDPDFVTRFTREARSAARLNAPEVVAVYDTGRDPGTGAAYLVMEHVEGRDLRALLQQRGALPPAQALSLMEPVLRALAAAHRAGIVHRDVKPENVLLGDDGRVKVADFGLARAVEASELTVTTGLLIGSVGYLAPEQVEHGTADPRTDVYAAGVLLWEMLAGSPPYSGPTPLSVAYRHVHDDVPPPSSVAGDLPPALDDLVVRATRRDPEQRPGDAGEFLAEVRALRQDLPLPAAARTDTLVVPLQRAVPAPGSTRVGRRRRRRAPLALLLVLLVGLLVAAGGRYVGSGRWTTAPGVLALSAEQAEAALTTAGLQVVTGPPGFDEDVPAGAVLDQDPDPGARVRKGGAVTLVLSKGRDRRPVPSTLVGARQQAAERALDDVGLRVGEVTQRFSDEPRGTVLKTTPAKGRLLRPGSTVALVVSKGVELLPVPDVASRASAEAQALLRGAGFTYATELVYSDDVPEGEVVAQSPASGTAPRGATVTLTVSRGPDLVQVPDLRGMGRDEAEATLEDLGLDPRAVDLPDGSGAVLTQSPAAGSRVRRGSVVTFYVL